MEIRLEEIKKRYEELSQKLNSPSIGKNPQELQRVAKEHNELKTTTEKIDNLEKINKEIKENEEILTASHDDELSSMAKEELETLRGRKNKLENELKLALLPKDPNDEKDVIVEIRAGAGGDESALFSEELFRMYLAFAQNKNWQTELLSSSAQEIGGFKEVIFRIQGDGAYSKMKYESGVHRVQRIPKTESKGRIHTSTATVAVLPEAEEVELEIKPEELKIDVFRSSGPGGQSVNTTDSAVRVTHIPSGLVVSCQDEKSQLKNKEKALKILRSRLLVQRQEEMDKEQGSRRKMQIGTGDRSEKIRTYNFPQSRITDHRIGYTTHDLEGILSGNLDEIIEELEKENQRRLLEEK